MEYMVSICWKELRAVPWRRERSIIPGLWRELDDVVAGEDSLTITLYLREYYPTAKMR